MPKILESDMEATIETDLIASGYFKREPEQYDKSLCLDPEMLINFIIATQPDQWENYRKQLGERARSTFLSKVKDKIDKLGTLELLRKPFTSYGVYFDLKFFKPASGMNEIYKKKYQGNIFSIMRQVKYSAHNENSLDIVLFLNGIPLATMELKDRMTGSGYNVESAMRQYQKERASKEPLFKFGRCLVHFALDEELVYMTTHLRNGKTKFLPFNKGNKGEAGNPLIDGFSTEYLWKEVLQKDSFLELLQHFIHLTDVFDEEGKPTGEKAIIFPRYHQMDAVHSLVKHAKDYRTGQQYLIQHSAGSGKSNTIAWLAHQLSNLHDTKDTNVFDSIIVVTDRRILDSQLRANVKAFEQNPGVVAGIDKGAKHLKQELEAGTKIIVTTLQKFPFIEEEIKNLPGNRFAIILDEAHSSASGEMSKSMKRVLNMNEEDDPEEEDKTWEDEIDEQIKVRGRQPNISYFAFTATPKPKTLELFGIKQEDGSFLPFHVYTMKQAIQEEFIKDVLPNYITYSTYFQLVKKITSDPNYDKVKASRLLNIFVEMNEHTIERKTAIIIEHFLENCINEIPDKNGKGQAKAMLVCSSRAQAVKYKIAFDKYLSERGINIKALVAFSGLIQPEGSHIEYSEARMNGFPENQTASYFKKSQYKFLIVANKFQTGFDQPLLYAMYVNKRLAGVNAVQTISRLNRVYPGKNNSITMDFINESKIIEKAFQDFYEDTMLEEGSDPDKLYDFKHSLEEFLYYTQEEVNQFAQVFFTKPFKQERLNPILITVINRYKEDTKDHQEKFRAVLKAYIRVYAFLSQIISFSDPELEKLYIFSRILFRKLPFSKQKLPKEVTQQVDLDSISMKFISKGIKVKDGEGGVFQPGDENPMGSNVEFQEPLSLIIKAINEKYATDFNDNDKVVAGSLLTRLIKDEEFEKEIKVNPEQNVWWSFEKKFNAKLQDMLEEHFDFYKKLNNNPDIKLEMMKNMFKTVYNQIKRAG
jgi:type I restriction enzyme, R subunit